MTFFNRNEETGRLARGGFEKANADCPGISLFKVFLMLNIRCAVRVKAAGIEKTYKTVAIQY
ncbi:hypothetical protein KBX73_12355 [Acetobacter persici]|uniref:hypothetical protein n=1 Tax=Acetobacter persici TaxID=1076596 RepID=UPI0020CD1946|nr:hypothetical protein [Acetobacter persici]MCP9320550.1 hypothetical protein [Acetobacter persici]